VAASSGGGAFGSSGGSSDYDLPCTRDITLFHFNGLTDGSRVPRCVRLRIKQPDASGGTVAEAEVFAQLGTLEAEMLAGMATAAGSLQGEQLGVAPAALHKQRQKDLESLQSVLRTNWVGATIVSCDQLVQAGTGAAEAASAPDGVDTTVWGSLSWQAAAPPKID
jgi:hypothetical protein